MLQVVIIFLVAFYTVVFFVLSKSKDLFRRGLIERVSRFPYRMVKNALRSATDPEDIRELRKAMALMHIAIACAALAVSAGLFLPRVYK